MKTNHVLIADDDLSVQKILKFVLDEAGYKVGLASNGREALQYVRAHHPPLILLDLFMPECDGVETLLEIKQHFPEAKVFMMSGGGTKRGDNLLAMSSKLGADGTIKKPLSTRSLLAMLEASCTPPVIRDERRALERRQATSAQEPG